MRTLCFSDLAACLFPSVNEVGQLQNRCIFKVHLSSIIVYFQHNPLDFLMK